VIGGDDSPAGVHASNLRLFEEQGFVVASDRFLQMDVLRRVGRGRLAEVLGSAAEQRDRETIGVGLAWAVKNSATRLENEYPDLHEYMLAYARGVNRYLSEIESLNPELVRQYRNITHDPTYFSSASEELRQQLPFWEPQDSIAVATSLSFYLSSSLKEKLTFGILFQIQKILGLDSENFLDLRPLRNTFILGSKYIPAKPTTPNNSPADLVEKAKLASEVMALGAKLKKFKYPFPDNRRASFGSNNWVVSRNYAAGDATLLANDPHLPLTFPSTFYEVALESRGFKVRGVMPPGIPGILIGHNEDIGWGFTNVGADVDDLYIEEMTDDYSEYRVGKRYKPVRVENIPLRVRNANGGIDVKNMALKFVDEHGPIFSEHFPELDALVRKVEKMGILGKHLAISYKWVGHPGSSEFKAIMDLNRAKDYASFHKALDHFESGAQNIIFADKLGNIGYYAHAKYPVRKYLSRAYPPYVMVEGANGKREWDKEFRKQMPEDFKNEGYIATANNDPFGHSMHPYLSEYGDYFGYAFSSGVRAYRISSLIEQIKSEKGSLEPADMTRIQLDKHDGMAMFYVSLLEKAKILDKMEAGPGRSLAESLINWRADGGWTTSDRREPVAFYEWLEKLMTDHFRFKSELVASWRKKVNGRGIDEVEKEWNDLVKEVHVSSMAVKTLYNQVNDALSGTNPNLTTEAAIKMIKTTLETAATSLASSGKTTATWGEVNKLVFANPLEGIVPPMFTLGLQRGGAWETVDPAGPGFGANFRVVMSLRPNAPIEATMTLPGGNFGPFDTNGLLQELLTWRDGRTRALVPFIQ